MDLKTCIAELRAGNREARHPLYLALADDINVTVDCYFAGRRILRNRIADDVKQEAWEKVVDYISERLLRNDPRLIDDKIVGLVIYCVRLLCAKMIRQDFARSNIYVKGPQTWRKLNAGMQFFEPLIERASVDDPCTLLDWWDELESVCEHKDEIKLIQMVSDEQFYDEIAEALGIDEEAVDKKLKAIFKRFQKWKTAAKEQRPVNLKDEFVRPPIGSKTIKSDAGHTLGA